MIAAAYDVEFGNQISEVWCESPVVAAEISDDQKVLTLALGRPLAPRNSVREVVRLDVVARTVVGSWKLPGELNADHFQFSSGGARAAFTETGNRVIQYWDVEKGARMAKSQQLPDECTALSFDRYRLGDEAPAPLAVGFKGGSAAVLRIPK